MGATGLVVGLWGILVLPSAAHSPQAFRTAIEPIIINEVTIQQTPFGEKSCQTTNYTMFDWLAGVPRKLYLQGSGFKTGDLARFVPDGKTCREVANSAHVTTIGGDDRASFIIALEYVGNYTLCYLAKDPLTETDEWKKFDKYRVGVTRRTLMGPERYVASIGRKFKVTLRGYGLLHHTFTNEYATIKWVNGGCDQPPAGGSEAVDHTNVMQYLDPPEFQVDAYFDFKFKGDFALCMKIESGGLKHLGNDVYAEYPWVKYNDITVVVQSPEVFEITFLPETNLAREDIKVTFYGIGLTPNDVAKFVDGNSCDLPGAQKSGEMKLVETEPSLKTTGTFTFKKIGVFKLCYKIGSLNYTSAPIPGIEIPVIAGKIIMEKGEKYMTAYTFSEMPVLFKGPGAGDFVGDSAKWVREGGSCEERESLSGVSINVKKGEMMSFMFREAVDGFLCYMFAEEAEASLWRSYKDVKVRVLESDLDPKVKEFKFETKKSKPILLEGPGVQEGMQTKFIFSNKMGPNSCKEEAPGGGSESCDLDDARNCAFKFIDAGDEGTFFLCFRFGSKNHFWDEWRLYEKMKAIVTDGGGGGGDDEDMAASSLKSQVAQRGKHKRLAGTHK